MIIGGNKRKIEAESLLLCSDLFDNYEQVFLKLTNKYSFAICACLIDLPWD